MSDDETGGPSQDPTSVVSRSGADAFAVTGSAESRSVEPDVQCSAITGTVSEPIRLIRKEITKIKQELSTAKLSGAGTTLNIALSVVAIVVTVVAVLPVNRTRRTGRVCSWRG